jgi:dephospho-CoA kinase
MKAKLLILFLIITANAFAQKKVEFKLDEEFFIRIPEDYRDTIINRQHFIFAEMDFGRAVLAKIDAPKGEFSKITKEDDLTKIYNDIERGMLRTIKGKLVAEEYIKVHDLKSKKISFLFEQEGNNYFDETLLVFFNNKIYIVQAIQAASMAKELKNQRDSLFASIRFANNISAKSQRNKVEKDNGSSFNIENLENLAGSILIIGVIVFFVMRAVRKKK